MSWFSMLVVFLLVWWVTLFMVLPLGVRGQAEEDEVVKGTEPGAPVDSQMKRKIILTTIISIVIWALICAMIIFEWIDWRMFSLYKGQ